MAETTEKDTDAGGGARPPLRTAPANPGDVPTVRSSRPTLRSIAYMTGLSVSAVSRALKDGADIGEETKRRVRLVADQIGYRPNRAGVRLRTGKTNVISLILNTEDEIMGQLSPMIYGISDVLASTPYHLVVAPYFHSHDPLDPVRYVVDTDAADGIIISRTQQDDPRVRLLTERGIPFVTHGRTTMGIAHAYADFDNQAFAFAAARRLIDEGRRRITLLGPPPNVTFHDHLRVGFRDALAGTGAVAVDWPATSIDDEPDTLHEASRNLMAGSDRPDGVISASGRATMALVAGLEAVGLKLRRDVGIVTKQTTNILPWFRKELFVVDEDIREAGSDLCSLLLRRIEGGRPEDLQILRRPRFP